MHSRRSTSKVYGRGGARCIKCAILERMYDFRAYEWPLSVMPRNYNNCSRSSIDYKKRSNNERIIKHNGIQ